MRRRTVLFGTVTSVIGYTALAGAQTPDVPFSAPPDQAGFRPDVPYLPTPDAVVTEMLTVADVSGSDILYDLGSGDGRIVITAARKFGTRGTGVELSAKLVRESNENARKAGVSDRVRFLRQDLFKTDLREATVVTLYLFSEVNIRLRPKLFDELKPGSRVVSHDFNMGEWTPDRTIQVPGPHVVYYWLIPARVAGNWQWSMPGGESTERYSMRLGQQFQKVSATVSAGDRQMQITDAKLAGDALSFTAADSVDGQRVIMRFSGRVSGDTVGGSVEVEGGPRAGQRDWQANRS